MWNFEIDAGCSSHRQNGFASKTSPCHKDRMAALVLKNRNPSASHDLIMAHLVNIPSARQVARLMRTQDAATYLGLGTKAIRQLIVCGELPYVQLKPGNNSPFLLDVRDLDRFIESRKARAPSA
jgi:excisionase family DNA binding protein